MRVSVGLAKVSGALKCGYYVRDDWTPSKSLERASLVPSLVEIVQYGLTHIPHPPRRDRRQARDGEREPAYQ